MTNKELEKKVKELSNKVEYMKTNVDTYKPKTPKYIFVAGRSVVYDEIIELYYKEWDKGDIDYRLKVLSFGEKDIIDITKETYDKIRKIMESE